jgi:hypothetical protein
VLNTNGEESQANQMVPEIVRIGVANARIKCVTPQRVEYLDESGQECFVDLEECVRNWVQYCNENKDEFVWLTSEDSAAAWNSRCVGQRDLLDDPPWVEFTNKRRTRLEFGSYEEAYELLEPLGKAGWHTFDAG